MLTFCRHRQLVEKNISLSTSWSKSFNGLNGSEVIRDEKTGVEDKKKGFDVIIFRLILNLIWFFLFPLVCVRKTDHKTNDE